MPLMDEFREERENVKKKSFLERIKYFWYYYKWYVIACVAIVVVAINIIYAIVSQKETVFYAAFLNSQNISGDSQFQKGFEDYINLDRDKCVVYFDTSIIINENVTKEASFAATQKLLVYTASSELDVIIGGSDIFSDYAYGEMFIDLREVLTEEQIKKYESNFYYIDKAVIDALDEAYTTAQTDTIPEFADPLKPEEMKEPIPVGIFVTDCSKLTDNYRFMGDYVVLGVIGNPVRLENTLEFIEYLFE